MFLRSALYVVDSIIIIIIITSRQFTCLWLHRLIDRIHFVLSVILKSPRNHIYRGSKNNNNNNKSRLKLRPLVFSILLLKEIGNKISLNTGESREVSFLHQRISVLVVSAAIHCHFVARFFVNHRLRRLTIVPTIV